MTEVNNPFTEETTKIITHQRDMILFDFIARGLALTHRPFNALELNRTRLNVAQTPVLWVMMEKQCEAATQQKLADYVRQGGKLILIGRLCEATFDHTPCTILQEALGIQQRHSAPPFTPAHIQAFTHPDIPVLFLETYSGAFDEVFATSADGQPVGFIQQVGQGRVMVLGAALTANTLDDLDILHQMANRMGCAPLFAASEWADVRLSEGENGSFLFVNNYQDDPLETTLAYNDQQLWGGHSLSLPARRGVILPLEWRLRPGILLHYLTAELTEIVEQDGGVTLKTDPPQFVAEISLNGYAPAPSLAAQPLGGFRWRVSAEDGKLPLVRA